MRFYFTLSFALSVVRADRPAFTDELVHGVNSNDNIPWNATNTRFGNSSAADAARLCGLKFDDPGEQQANDNNRRMLATCDQDGYCKTRNGPGSYCKTWALPPTCFGGNQPCACTAIAAAQPTATPTTMAKKVTTTTKKSTSLISTTKPPVATTTTTTTKAPTVAPTNAPGTIPASFDARVAWPSCAGVIGHVRDQGSCGNCWAMSSTHSFNSRLCIATGGKFQRLISPTHTTACCTTAQGSSNQGCNGGSPNQGWKWFAAYGVVTGGDAGDSSTCWPYPATITNTPACPTSCPSTGYTTPFSSDRHFASPTSASYSMPKGDITAIKREIMTNGPVVAGMEVYYDFFTYSSGVYTPTTTDWAGAHAIMLIGWGSSNGIDYWLGVNSWSVDWGMAGVFKIQMGVCNIEQSVNAGAISSVEQTR